eukprot:9264078-Pyramimonas_sp.AAC.1
MAGLRLVSSILEAERFLAVLAAVVLALAAGSAPLAVLGALALALALAPAFASGRLEHAQVGVGDVDARHLQGIRRLCQFLCLALVGVVLLVFGLRQQRI